MKSRFGVMRPESLLSRLEVSIRKGPDLDKRDDTKGRRVLSSACGFNLDPAGIRRRVRPGELHDWKSDLDHLGCNSGSGRCRVASSRSSFGRLSSRLARRLLTHIGTAYDSTYSRRHSGALNGAAKYWVSSITRLPWSRTTPMKLNTAPSG